MAIHVIPTAQIQLLLKLGQDCCSSILPTPSIQNAEIRIVPEEIVTYVVKTYGCHGKYRNSW
jgi:hypothetical protein